MLSFFRSLNFPRTVILVSLLASAVIGYLDYGMTAELSQLESDLSAAPLTVQRIQSTALELESLMDIANAEGLKGQEDPELYIRRTAQLPRPLRVRPVAARDLEAGSHGAAGGRSWRRK